MTFTVELHKESFKFSGTHFTIFGAGRAERLHGHNYHVKASLVLDQIDPELGMAFDFNAVKPLLKAECEALDEYVLLPSQSPHLKISDEGDNVEVQFGKKTYVFPRSDVRELPVVNVTSEELAKYFCDRLIPQIKGLAVNFIEITVEETRGQSVRYSAKVN